LAHSWLFARPFIPSYRRPYQTHNAPDKCPFNSDDHDFETASPQVTTLTRTIS
jgi:hypothetical protein